MTNTLTRTRRWLAENGSILLILSVLVLFSTKTLFNIPLTIMGLIVIYRFFSRRYVGDKNMVRLLLLLFLCLWLPMLISIIDAVNMSHAAKTVFPYFRFFLAGVYIIQEINSAEKIQKLLTGLFIIICAWCLDALVQYVVGKNVFGQPYDPHIGLAGMFYPKVRLPHLLAVTAPLCFELVRRYSSHFRWLWLTLPPVFFVLLLGEKRTAWMMLLVAVFAYLTCMVYSKRLQAGKVLLGVVVVVALLVLATMNDSFRHKVDKTSGLFSADTETVDEATARRLSLWQIGNEIFSKNWLNGIGPRGFRYVDTKYADEDNFWVQGERHGQTHPHLFIMEILVETGLIGLAGYVIFFILMARAIKSRLDNVHYLPWFASIIVVIFPFNAHLAFYGSYWSSVVWWFVPLGVAALYHDKYPD